MLYCVLVFILLTVPVPLYAQNPDEQEQAEPVGTTLEEPATGAGGEVVIKPVLESVEGEDTALRQAMVADSVWRAWMEPDSLGLRHYWFRYAFETDAPPSSGRIWLTADDDFYLYLNGVYIATDTQDSVDWMNVMEYDVGEYLRYGKNIIALEAVDLDATRYGLRVGLIYETIPDIEEQLNKMVKRELEAQDERRQEQMEREAAEREATGGEALTPAEQWEMRTIEKNKLR